MCFVYVDSADWLYLGTTRVITGQAQIQIVAPGIYLWATAESDEPAILLQSEIITLGDPTADGVIVSAVRLPWFKISEEIRSDPHFLRRFPNNHRKFEEFLAGIYEQQGFDVVLTPQRADGGRDVIATKSGILSIRVLGQAKAYSPHHLVTHDEVRALLGVLSADQNASKGMLVTTSDFQPGVYTAPQIQQFVPHRLELINGTAIPTWLESISKPIEQSPTTTSE